jgi:hypothetical protein
MKDRRAPWLLPLIAAVILSVWMIGQVIAGVVTLAMDVVSDADPGFAPVPTQPQP